MPNPSTHSVGTASLPGSCSTAPEVAGWRNMFCCCCLPPSTPVWLLAAYNPNPGWLRQPNPQTPAQQPSVAFPWPAKPFWKSKRVGADVPSGSGWRASFRCQVFWSFCSPVLSMARCSPNKPASERAQQSGYGGQCARRLANSSITFMPGLRHGRATLPVSGF